MERDAIFQIDHPLVCSAFNGDNYRISIDESAPEGRCAIYFSSHDIYFPNDERAFKSRVVDGDFYEWYKTRLKGVRKHIFLRDVHKQWYISGINSRTDTPEKLLSFLKGEVGSCEVITLGSSAGGFAAVYYGAHLNASRVFTFNGQMELNSILHSSSELINPLVFRMSKGLSEKYYDLKPLLNGQVKVFYFYSIFSHQDAQQANHVVGATIDVVGFRTSHHGVPFLKCALGEVLSLSEMRLLGFSGRVFSPFLFSINCVGILRVGVFSIELLGKLLRQRAFRVFRKRTQK